jgi:hypothetical protein
MKTTKVCKWVVLATILLSVVSCSTDEQESIKPSNYTSTSTGTNNSSPVEEYIQNPSVKKAISESGIEINQGTTPPALAGNYVLDGEVVDASKYFYSTVSAAINSQFNLYNQTASGKISFSETLDGISVSGSGGYITGKNGKFTLYQESQQSGAEAGLPDGVTMTAVFIMSGTKLSNGDVEAKGITIITEGSGDYDFFVGQWWMWQSTMELQ